VGLFLTLIGVPPRWTIAIGIVTAASNVVPYLGSAVALVSALAYALLAEDIRPLLPMVSPENFAIWVVAAVILAQLLDNIVLEPFVLGSVVKLHPLVVVIGVVAGAILFGTVGMLFAIPAMTVFKVLVSSTGQAAQSQWADLNQLTSSSGPGLGDDRPRAGSPAAAPKAAAACSLPSGSATYHELHINHERLVERDDSAAEWLRLDHRSDWKVAHCIKSQRVQVPMDAPGDLDGVAHRTRIEATEQSERLACSAAGPDLLRTPGNEASSKEAFVLFHPLRRDDRLRDGVHALLLLCICAARARSTA
jgi:hypothetical protein